MCTKVNFYTGTLEQRRQSEDSRAVPQQDSDENGREPIDSLEVFEVRLIL